MKSLAAALVEAQKKMPVVHRTATANTGTFQYSYVTLDQLIEKTKPVLIEHDLVIAQFPSETSNGGPGLRTVLLHGESGEQIAATVPLLLNGKNDMQTLGGAITYARRYGWAAVLGIANEEDDDAASASAPGTGAAPKVSTGLGGQGGQAAGSSPTSRDSSAAQPFTPPASAAKNSRTGEGGDWTWPFGKHKGTRLEDTPLEYVMWYAEQGTKEDVKQKCNVFLAVPGGGFEPDDEGIPFRSTIDGLGG